MDIRSEVLDYIYRKEFTGALLLTGQWGCGKSYLVKAIAKDLNNSKIAAVAVVSLFGLDSISAINKRVKDEYTGFLLGSLGKTARKVSKALSTVAKDGMAVASVASGGAPGLSAASQGLSSVMTYDLLGFIEIKNTIGKDEKEHQFIIVFDDLERNNLPKKDLLGAINEYVENKQIKVIIVADQEKISSDDYKEYKEKLISRTIKMTADYETLIDCILNDYSETAGNYKAFLMENSSLLKQVFKESGSDNLRTLKTILADFERIYEAWIEVNVPTDNMKWALYSFSAEMFVSKVPKKEEPNQDKQNASFFFEKKEEQYAYRGKNRSSFSSFHAWIYSGIWNKELFIKELKSRYTEKEDTPLERFLYYHFWSLQQKDIDEGLPSAIDLAYNGALSRDNLIALLTKVHYLKTNSVTIPCEIDYQRIEAGLNKRIDEMKKGSIIEPKCHTFATNDQIDPEAHLLYEKIRAVEDKMDAWENRAIYIEYLCEEETESRSSIRGLYIEELDSEFLSIFKDKYLSADNYNKREYATSLLGLVFDFDTYSTEENILRTRQNFLNLIDWLKSLPDDDSITMLINNSFIEHIQASEIMNSGQQRESLSTVV